MTLELADEDTGDVYDLQGQYSLAIEWYIVR
jgi:hypothetical protein